mmetsp:Transcript_50037/g.126112  ORF Transcript_50037/g.126112 Transcript_50037/m.126112 type:complete len:445 (+) Transcript_50037:99-1433(+)
MISGALASHAGAMLAQAPGRCCRPGACLKFLAACLLYCGRLALAQSAPVCPGTTSLSGYGPVSLVNAKWNKENDAAGGVHVTGNTVDAGMKGRGYFGDSCSDNYDSAGYLGLKLLGQQLSYTVNLAGVGCGCNAALYLTPMQQNKDPSSCGDYYCDAAKVCGVACAELDIQEANNRAWYSTLHTSTDPLGAGSGYGSRRHDWNASVYGPGARCIDTSKPFDVTVAFPTDASGQLSAMEVTLMQAGSTCPLALRIQGYGGMSELTEVLQQGVTPIISYWGVGETMLWMDGRGEDGKGPCEKEAAETCAASVSFSAFSVAPIPFVAMPSPSPAYATAPTAPPTTNTSNISNSSLFWVAAMSVGLLAMAMGLGSLPPVSQPLEEGLEVTLRNQLVKNRSCLGRSKLSMGTRGRILSLLGARGAVVEFDGHWGTFELSREETHELMPV